MLMKSHTSLVHSEINFFETEKLEKYSKFFKKPLLNYTNLNLEPESIILQLYEDLKHQNRKANHLVELTDSMRKVYEGNLKVMKKFENYRENAEYKFEKLNSQIEELHETNYAQEKKIEEISAYLDETEKKLNETYSERDLYKKEFTVLKKALKNKEVEIENALTQERKKSGKDKEEDLKKIEYWRTEANNKERIIEETTHYCGKLENQLIGEKNTSEKLRNSISLLKSEIFELKNKLKEEKIKKSKYKLMSKQPSIKLRSSVEIVDPGTFTFAPFSEMIEQEKKADNFEDFEENKGLEENALYGLEEEQCRAQSVNYHSIQISDDSQLNFSQVSERNTESMIFIIPPKLTSTPERNFSINQCDSISVQRKQSVFSMCQYHPIAVKPKKPKLDYSKSTVESTFKKIPVLTEQKGKKAGFLVIRSKKKIDLKIEEINEKIQELAKKTPESCLSLETWTDSFPCTPASTKRINYIEEEVQQSSEYLPQINSNHLPHVIKDPIKEYFINTCKSVKSVWNYSDKIVKVPMNSLYQNLLQQNVPLYQWPEAIQVYLAERVKRFS